MTEEPAKRAAELLGTQRRERDDAKLPKPPVDPKN
jgi:hypothetical protein